MFIFCNIIIYMRIRLKMDAFLRLFPLLLLLMPFSMKGQTDCDLLLTVNNKDQQITIDRQTHWTHSAGVGGSRIVVRVAEKDNSIDTLFINPVGCSQYEIRMTPDSVKLAIYTTISPYWDEDCCLEDAPMPKTSDFELKFILDITPDKIRGRIYYYPEIMLRGLEDSYLATLPQTTYEWYDKAVEQTNVPTIVAWLFKRGYVMEQIETAIHLYGLSYNERAKDDNYGEQCEKKHINTIVQTFSTILPYLDMELREAELAKLAHTLIKIWEIDSNKQLEINNGTYTK